MPSTKTGTKDRLPPQSRHGIRSISPFQGASTRPCQIRGRIRSNAKSRETPLPATILRGSSSWRALARILRRHRHPSSIAPAYCNRAVNLSVSARTNSPISLDDGNVTTDSGTEFASRMPPTRVHSFCEYKGPLCASITLSRLHLFWSWPAPELTFFAVPIAQADARSIASGSVDVFQIHQTVGKLPLQNVHDMSFVFPSPAA